MWFSDALLDKKLKKAIQRLRLRNGDFKDQADECVPGDRRTRMFFVEGPRGGIHGILLANPFHPAKVTVGVFVDRKSRRRNFGTQLVEAASTYYPMKSLQGVAWNEVSARFWMKLRPLTRQNPVDYVDFFSGGK
jgi:GNAT superfamily N-acetyltransferase